MKTTTPPVRNSINHSSRDCHSVARLLIALMLVCFVLLPGAQATDLDSVLPNGNTADGSGVLVGLTSGVWNSGFGFQALNHDTAGKDNTATGLRGLFSNTSGSNNTATGVYSLYSNTTGWYNNAVGAYALAHNTEGNYNTANGYGALYFNTEGEQNTVTGFAALYRNNTGPANTANGHDALLNNTTGNFNTANGRLALSGNTTANNNTADGAGALQGNTTGHDNTALGFEAGSLVTTANNVIAIGAAGANVSNSCFIGNIFGATASGGTAVFIDSSGQLGTTTSSRRFKKEIKAMERASETILSLKPVTFHYKSDATGTPQFGLIAEEVAEINPDLVVRDENGEIYTVRYDAVNAMLLNEFLKEHYKVQEQAASITQLTSTVAQQKKDFQATVAQQEKEIKSLTASLKEQAAQIQKVSAQLEVSEPAPKTISQR